MVSIVVRGDGNGDLEQRLKEAVGGREGDWVVVVVRFSGDWVVTFPVSPGNVLEHASWFGPRHGVVEAVRRLMGRGTASRADLGQLDALIS